MGLYKGLIRPNEVGCINHPLKFSQTIIIHHDVGTEPTFTKYLTQNTSSQVSLIMESLCDMVKPDNINVLKLKLSIRYIDRATQKMADRSDLKAELERKKQRLAQIREEKKRKEEERKKKEVRSSFVGSKSYFCKYCWNSLIDLWCSLRCFRGLRMWLKTQIWTGREEKQRLFCRVLGFHPNHH